MAEPYDLSDFSELDDVDLDELGRALDQQIRDENCALVAHVNERGQVNVLYTFELESGDQNTITYKMTGAGKRLLINGFGRSTLERLEGTLELEDGDHLSLLLGMGQGPQSDMRALLEDQDGAPEMIAKAKEHTSKGGGKFVVCRNKRELGKLMESRLQVSTRTVVNAGATLPDIKAAKESRKPVYFLANGSELREVHAKYADTNDPIQREKDEGRLAAEHAAMVAARRKGIPVPASHFFVCPVTGRKALLVELPEKAVIRKAERRGEHFYVPAVEKFSRAVRYNMGELRSLMIGRPELATSGDACLKAFRVNQQANPKSNADLMAVLIFNKLIGSESNYGETLGFLVTTGETGGTRLAMAPFADLDPSLMDGPSADLIRQSGMNGRTLDRLTVNDLVDSSQVLDSMHSAAPKAFEAAFEKAKAAQREMIKILETEMAPRKEVSREQVIAIKRYLGTPIGDQPYMLDRGVTGITSAAKDGERKNDLAQDNSLPPPDDDLQP